MLMEAFDVQEESLFDSVNETHTRDVIRTIKLLDSLAVQNMNWGLDSFARQKTKYVFSDSWLLSETLRDQIKFPNNDLKQNVSSFISTTKTVISSIKHLYVELNSSAPNTVKALSFANQVFFNNQIYEKELTELKQVFDNDLNHFAKSLDNISSFSLS
uniref:Uncharacterized protein n=1 Tax=Caenorhabditis japonica TaxID=281687 RepID=A0A8R1EUX6_CAEJA